MKLAFQLAYKNLIGAGLRTWLNVAILSFCFVIIIFFNGIIDGWNQQAKKDSVEWEYGNGQLIYEYYDVFDPFTIQDGHGILPQKEENLFPILIRQASLYPKGRMISINLKGIDCEQNTLKLPLDVLKNKKVEFPVLIGKRMASTINAKKGDEILVRWRDSKGMYDATMLTIVDVFDTNVPTIDNGQLWMPIEKLWEMTNLKGHATMFVANENYQYKAQKHWVFRDKKDLLKELDDIIQTKKASSSIMYLLLLAIALLAIFDTQVLSIFRRQKEIGTYIALGMTKNQVVRLFTIEGAMYSFFAMIVGCLYGVPLFIYLAKVGIAIPAQSQDMGIAVADKIYPVFGITLIIETILLIVISATIVSFIPAIKIAKMNPVEALKGKLQ